MRLHRHAYAHMCPAQLHSPGGQRTCEAPGTSQTAERKRGLSVLTLQGKEERGGAHVNTGYSLRMAVLLSADNLVPAAGNFSQTYACTQLACLR